MLRAVTFDLWQTLLLDTAENLRLGREARLREIGELLAGAGHAVSPAGLNLAYDHSWQRLEAVWRSHEDVGPRGQLRWMLESLGVAGAVPESSPLMAPLEAAYCEPILAFPPYPNPGALELLAALKERGFMLGLICNTGRTPGRMLRRVLRRLCLAEHLSVMTFSDEVGLRKPRPELFRQTLAALGAAPAEAVHIGDDVDTDMAGARGIGMRAVHLCHATSASPVPDPQEAVPTLTAFRELLLRA
ncbi:MAG: HAD family hydrolase [Candidatus Methylomirabilota bacterium]